MGIHGLKSLLKKTCPDVFELIHISEYRHKKIAIDISMFVNKYKKSVGDRWLSQVLNLVVCLRRNDIHCIFIYDGKAPPEKDRERDKRKSAYEKTKQRTKDLEDALDYYQETNKILPILEEFGKKTTSRSPKRLLTKKDHGIDMSMIARKIEKRATYSEYPTVQDFELTKCLLDILKVPWFVAPMEAETTCADMCKRGLVDAVMSEDSDVLAYGTVNFLTDFSASSCCCVRIQYENVIKQLGLSSRSFLDLCIMCGNDYNDNIPMIGPHKSLKMLKEYEDIEGIHLSTGIDVSILNYERTRELFTDYIQVNENIKHCGVPDYKKLAEFKFVNNLHTDIDGIKSSFEDARIYFEE